MSPEPQNPALVEQTEPQVGNARIPVWMFVLLFVVGYWAMLYFDQRSAWFSGEVYAPYHSMAQLQVYQPPTGGANLERGRSVYDNICALCHNTDGSGKPGQAPTFVGSEWVLGTPARLIRIPLVGLSGPVQVKGQTWALSMPAMGASLSDEDLAAVLSYMRSSWGNKAPEVTPDEVKAVRGEVGSRSQPWSAEELSKIQ